MRKKRIIILLLALLLIVASAAIPAMALGDDLDYGWDMGGGWDDSGGDWGGGGGGDLGGLFNMLFFVGRGDSSIILIILLLAIFIIFKNRNKIHRSGSSGNRQSPNANMKSGGISGTFQHKPGSLAELQRQDPRFSAADLEAKVKNWVQMFEQCWANGDMSPCSPFISDGLFHSYQSQLSMMRQNGEASRTEDLSVLNCSLESWTQDGDKEYLNIWIKEKKRNYKVDINDPSKIIKGDRNITYYLEYRWQLMRSAGSKTEDGGVGARVQECPNCGAQTSINQSGKCEYCGSTIVAENFDWVLNKVDKLAQTSHKG